MRGTGLGSHGPQSDSVAPGSTRMTATVLRRWLSVFLLVLPIGTAGCAAARVEGAAQVLSTGRYAVTLELSNFAFRPNVATAEARRPITVTAVGKSIARHNVTIISSDGELLANVDVPAGQTRTFDVTLPQPGTYELYCDVGLHRPFGMEGVFVAK